MFQQGRSVALTNIFRQYPKMLHPQVGQLLFEYANAPETVIPKGTDNKYRMCL
ncbi:MAG: hypothetical protein R2824_19650 [Saprospiraceae bacterium]